MVTADVEGFLRVGLFNVDELAAKTKVSRRTLTKCFKEKTGLSIKQFQLNLKLQMAASLLANSPHASVKQVAEQFGFYDEFHFSRLFKRKMGQAPSELRIPHSDGKLDARY